MLKIDCGSGGPMCDGVSRRSFMAAGALGLGGLTLADLAAANPGSSYLKDKSVVLLFLGGGPSQLETWDPKPDGKGTSTSIAGHIPTALRGVRFASYFPKMAELADRLTIVRSFYTHHAEHNGAHKQILTADTTIPDGKPIRHPGMGAIYARAAGAVHPVTGMLRHALIPPTTKHIPSASGFTGAYESVVEGCQPAYLGPSYAPFEVHVPMAEGEERAKKKKGRDDDDGGGNPLLKDLEPHLPPLRLDARLGLLNELDRVNRQMDAGGAMASVDAQTARALEVLRGGQVRRALDLSRENPMTLAAYDTEHFRNYRCNDQSQFERNGPSIGISLGRQLLLARRLCEAGCGFVTVIHSNWDFHARKGIPNMPEGMSVLAPPLDHAVAAFLYDIRERGLEDKILLVITGEFGRTPTLDSNLGRHHWPRLCPLVFAGGGLNHGQVVGASDTRGGEPADAGYSIDDLHATVMHALFDVGQMRLDSALPKIVQERASRGRVIQELF
jgi:uncharacterized protein (DUF1501 family)